MAVRGKELQARAEEHSHQLHSVNARQKEK